MGIIIRPRLEVVSFSLYWKESLLTTTECLDDIEITLPSSKEGVTGQDLLVAVAQQLGWREVESLQRLEGFTLPWERLLIKGRELKLEEPLPASDDPVVVVRRVLKADGWRIAQQEDFLTSDDEDDA